MHLVLLTIQIHVDYDIISLSRAYLYTEAGYWMHCWAWRWFLFRIVWKQLLLYRCVWGKHTHPLERTRRQHCPTYPGPEAPSSGHIGPDISEMRARTSQPLLLLRVRSCHPSLGSPPNFFWILRDCVLGAASRASGHPASRFSPFYIRATSSEPPPLLLDSQVVSSLSLTPWHQPLPASHVINMLPHLNIRLSSHLASVVTTSTFYCLTDFLTHYYDDIKTVVCVVCGCCSGSNCCCCNLTIVPLPPPPPHTDTNQVDDVLANATATMTVLPGAVTVKSGHSRGPMDTRTHLHNKLIQKDQNKKTQSYKVESLSGGANVDIHNFSLENKRETEYVSHTQT